MDAIAQYYKIMCLNGKLKVVEFLIEKGVNIKNSFSEFNSACIYGGQNDNFEIAELFIKHDFDINTPDLNGQSNLTMACHIQNIKILEFLIKHDVDLNKKYDLYKTPLYISSIYNYQNVVKFLLENGADIGILHGDENITCLQIANQRGYVEIASMIKSAQAAQSLLTKTSIETLKQFFKENCINMEEVLIQDNVEIIIACVQRLIKNSPNLKTLQQNCFNLDINLKILSEEGIEVFQPLFKFATSSLLKLNCLESLNNQLEREELILTEKEKSLIKLAMGNQEDLLKVNLFSDLFEALLNNSRYQMFVKKQNE